jgi:antitoxin (DNA-binding transcriptional repressor) of toxin-antitoxin stability system
MVTKTVDIRETQPPLAEILELTSPGDEVFIVEGDRLVARLGPVGASLPKRIMGLDEGAIWMSDDFDEPLPDEFWLGRGWKSCSIHTSSSGWSVRQASSRSMNAPYAKIAQANWC